MYCDIPVLGRCCFCMPLRRGILTFGYINIVLSAVMIGLFSHALRFRDPWMVYFRGSNVSLPSGICIALHCFDLFFNALLVYGAHKVLKKPITVFYYYSISTIFASLLLQTIDLILQRNAPYLGPMMLMEILPLLLASLLLEVYLIILVRSLLRKMEHSGPNVYENQLQQIVFEGKTPPNGVYNNPTAYCSTIEEDTSKVDNSPFATES